MSYIIILKSDVDIVSLILPFLRNNRKSENLLWVYISIIQSVHLDFLEQFSLEDDKIYSHSNKLYNLFQTKVESK